VEFKIFAKAKKLIFKIINNWLELQILVNYLLDFYFDGTTDVQFSGIRRIIEKKEGIFIKNLMGKRVNFAARSMLSPDPYINGSNKK
jgi:DNA-directed RNA polymerase I subunit RPA1